MTSEARVTVLMANNQDHQSFLFEPVDEQIRHGLEWIHPSAPRQFGPKIGIAEDKRANPFDLGEETAGGCYAEAVLVSLDD